jgi:DNA-binding MarR family transcriptional regulator
MLESLGLAIKRIQHRHHRALDGKMSAALGISLVQWNALREIDRNPGSAMHALAELTFNSDQAFGTLAQRLKRLGLVKQKPGPGRAIVLGLTDKGLELRRRGQAILLEVATNSFAPLNERERVTLLKLLTKMLEG